MKKLNRERSQRQQIIITVHSYMLHINKVIVSFMRTTKKKKLHNTIM